MLTKPRSIIDAYASTWDCGFQTLNVISIFMWIRHAFIHACWCSSNTSLHLREAPPSSMSSWHHHTILYARLLVVAQWWRWSSSMMTRNLFGKFSWSSNYVHKLAIRFMFVRFWSYSTCYSPVMNVDRLSFVCFF